MHINLTEAAKLLNVPEVTVKRWSDKGLLTCHRGENETFFDEQELIAFIHKTSFGKVELVQLEHEKELLDLDDKFILTRAFNRGVFSLINEDLSRDQIFAKIADLVLFSYKLKIDRNLLFAKLVERENEVSTVLGHQIALPHPKKCAELNFEKSMIFTVSLDHEIKMSDDSEGCSLLFFIFSKNPSEHLKLLSTIAKIVHLEPNLVELIATLNSRLDLVNLIKSYESKLLK